MDRDPVTVKSVKTIQDGEKHWLEGLLGRGLQANRQAFILAFTPRFSPSDEAHRQTLAELEQTWAQVEQHRRAHGVTDEEFDDAADDAMKAVRPTYEPPE